MEGFSLILNKCIEEAIAFGYHKGCDELKITHLCFADDLFVFTRGDVPSVMVVKRALDIFEKKSGLSPSLEKSEVFFGNVDENEKQAILNCLPFSAGTFPIRYLGVPLSTCRLKVMDYGPLLDKVRKRVHNWKSKYLSFGGRLQLIKSVLSSLQLYWMSVFMLPSGVVHDLEAMFRNFLWAQGDSSKGKCRVAWSEVCKPFPNGGVGIRRISVWNRALLAKHIWDFLKRRDSLWIKWCFLHYIRESQFWLVTPQSNWSWVLKRILQLRPSCRPYFINSIGDGSLTNAWEDTWLEHGFLAAHIPFRLIRAAGFGKESVVRDVVLHFSNGWPQEWVDRWQVLASNPIPILNDSKSDTVEWRSGLQGHKEQFSVSKAWKAFDGQRLAMNWCKLVWFKGCIPKYSFCTWLAFLRRLPTQDKIISWKHNPPDLKCPLCEVCLDSHNHLFFECDFALEIWNGVKKDADMMTLPNSWETLAQWIEDGLWFPKRSAQKLALTAAVYHVWQERNKRLFESKKRSAAQIGGEIREAVVHRLAWKFQAKKRCVAQ